MVEICPAASEECLEKGEDVIRTGEILVYPTDTLYGFGVDARNISAVERLSVLKERNGPWSLLVTDMEMLERYAEIPDDKRSFVVSHVPGKVTLILRAKKSDLSPDVLGENRTIGVRIPNHPYPIHLTARLRFPITTTSVNRTGQPPLNNPDTIVRVFGDEIALIADGGTLPPSTGSRVYDLSADEITLLRDMS